MWKLINMQTGLWKYM